MIPVGVELEVENALIDTQSVVNEYGTEIEIVISGEPDITRDKYNSIKRRIGADSVTLQFKAFPVEYSPSRKQIEKAGLKEVCECMIHTAYKDWSDFGYDVDALDLTRMTILMDGCSFRMKEKGYSDRFTTSFLYVTFGLTKI